VALSKTAQIQSEPKAPCSVLRKTKKFYKYLFNKTNYLEFKKCHNGEMRSILALPLSLLPLEDDQQFSKDMAP
jgi:ABC-type uncharacterized transport system YnjBCD substrate-binding protein